MEYRDEYVTIGMEVLKTVCRKISNNRTEFYEEYYSLGLVELTKALQTYDESKNIKFKTYASRCIHNGIYNSMTLKSAKKRTAEIVSFKSKVEYKRGKFVDLGDTLKSETSIDESVLCDEMIELIMDNLDEIFCNEIHKIAFEMRYRGYHPKNICEVIKYRYSNYSRLNKIINRKLFNYLTSKGYNIDKTYIK